MTFEHDSQYRRLIAALAILAVIAGALYLLGRDLDQDIDSDSGDPAAGEPVFCTMEAKLCPDGSSVGRQSPDCEFAPCPGSPAAGGQESPATSPAGTPEGPSLAEQIRACMPLSNWEAKLTCDRLIAQIDGYDECAAAGFFIEEMFPPRCSTPDGRTFTKSVTITEPTGDNLGWQEVVEAVRGCQAIAVMQAHSLDVSVTLKEGRRIKAVEPQIDDIIILAVQARQECDMDIAIGTE